MVTGLYQTFSLYTENSGMSIIDNLKTLKFILGNNKENSVIIASGSTKNIAITVSNQDKITLQYGVYYSTTSALTDVYLGYLPTSEYPATGLIEKNSDYVVTIRVHNYSDNAVTINFGLVYGFEKGGNLILNSDQTLVDTFSFPLTYAEVGSYVTYTGNNGCTGASCNGQNANYVSDSDMGYCSTSNIRKYKVNGWRIAYQKEGTPYIISAGSPECLQTLIDGSNETTTGYPVHMENLSNAALKYCNSSYAYKNICNEESAWNINMEDLQTITGGTLTALECHVSNQGIGNPLCGAGNDLLDNGGYYWFSETNGQWLFYWDADPSRHCLGNIGTNVGVGLRPVLRLNNSVKVTGGTGTYQDPYLLSSAS